RAPRLRPGRDRASAGGPRGDRGREARHAGISARHAVRRFAHRRRDRNPSPGPRSDHASPPPRRLRRPGGPGAPRRRRDRGCDRASAALPPAGEDRGGASCSGAARGGAGPRARGARGGADTTSARRLLRAALLGASRVRRRGRQRSRSGPHHRRARPRARAPRPRDEGRAREPDRDAPPRRSREVRALRRRGVGCALDPPPGAVDFRAPRRRGRIAVRFAEPWYLLLFVPFLAAFWLARRRILWKDPELAFSSLTALPPTAGLRARAARAWPALRILAVGLILLAAARPQGGREMREVVSQGIDIALAIDISGSMRSEDFRPKNRLYVSKEVAKEFVRGRQQDRIGLVAFAGQSELISPLTLDYDGLIALIDGLDFGQIPDGTAVGSAIAQATERLRKAPGKSKVLILLTDGISNAGAVDPITAAKLAKAVGVRIYAVGAGTQGLAPFPVDDPILGRHYVWVSSEVDEATLRQVAS